MSIAAKCTCFKRPSGWCSGDDCPKAIKQSDDKQLIEKYSVLIAEFMGWKLVCLNPDDEDEDFIETHL